MTDFTLIGSAKLLLIPLCALVPAAFFFVLAREARPNVPTGLRFAAKTWVLYTGYEVYMYFWSRDEVVPIRIDLLLIIPLLIAATIAGFMGIAEKPPTDEADPRPPED